MTRYQVIWDGPVRETSGIGTASREYALALYRQGVDVKVLTPRKRPLAKNPDPNPQSILAILANKPMSRTKPKVLIYHRPPNTLNFQLARKKYDYILLNTVWETTQIPNHWFPSINQFDAVCVPSVQNKVALRKSGVNVPIFLVPHGVNTRAFTPANKKTPLPILPGTFVFVSAFTFQHRKNPETLLRAYWEEFSAKDRVALVIKTSGFNPRENGRWIRNRVAVYKKKLGIGRHTAPIHLITGRTSPKKLKGIYTSGNAFVLPTRGEGVGLPFLESLASGVPVIATRWGGHMDFLNKRNSFLVNYRMKPPALGMKTSISRPFRSLFAQHGQLWAEPDRYSLRKQMRAAYQNPALCRKKGQQGRKDMLNQSWGRSGIALKRAIEQAMALHPIRRRKGMER